MKLQIECEKTGFMLIRPKLQVIINGESISVKEGVKIEVEVNSDSDIYYTTNGLRKKKIVIDEYTKGLVFKYSRLWGIYKIKNNV